MVAFVVAIMISIPFMANDIYTSAIAKSVGGTDTSCFCAGLIYIALRRVGATTRFPARGSIIGVPPLNHDHGAYKMRRSRLEFMAKPGMTGF